MIDLRYSSVIEATEDPNFFCFYATELPGFTGVGRSVDDCIDKARGAMEEHVQILREQGLEIPPPNPKPKVVIENEPALVDTGA